MLIRDLFKDVHARQALEMFRINDARADQLIEQMNSSRERYFKDRNYDHEAPVTIEDLKTIMDMTDSLAENLFHLVGSVDVQSLEELMYCVVIADSALQHYRENMSDGVRGLINTYKQSVDIPVLRAILQNKLDDINARNVVVKDPQ